MKKIVKLLLLFVVPLLFVACSDDEYEDLQIPVRTINGTVEVTGSVDYVNGTWFLIADLNSILNLDPSKEATEIKIRNVFSDDSLENLLNLDYGGHTFTVKLILYRIEHDKPLSPYQEYVGTIYYYVADIYDIDYA